MEKWITAVWMRANSKSDISSYDMALSLEITQKSAWFLRRRLNKALLV
jgi:hypothetical protein